MSRRQRHTPLVPLAPAHRRTWRSFWRRCSCGLKAPCVDRLVPAPALPFPARTIPAAAPFSPPAALIAPPYPADAAPAEPLLPPHPNPAAPSHPPHASPPPPAEPAAAPDRPHVNLATSTNQPHTGPAASLNRPHVNLATSGYSPLAGPAASFNPKPVDPGAGASPYRPRASPAIDASSSNRSRDMLSAFGSGTLRAAGGEAGHQHLEAANPENRSAAGTPTNPPYLRPRIPSQRSPMPPRVAPGPAVSGLRSTSPQPGTAVSGPTVATSDPAIAASHSAITASGPAITASGSVAVAGTPTLRPGSPTSGSDGAITAPNPGPTSAPAPLAAGPSGAIAPQPPGFTNASTPVAPRPTGAIAAPAAAITGSTGGFAAAPSRDATDVPATFGANGADPTIAARLRSPRFPETAEWRAAVRDAVARPIPMRMSAAGRVGGTPARGFGAGTESAFDTGRGVGAEAGRAGCLTPAQQHRTNGATQ